MPQTYAIIYKYNRFLTSMKRGNYYEDIKNIMLYGSRLPHSLQPERLQSAKGCGQPGQRHNKHPDLRNQSTCRRQAHRPYQRKRRTHQQGPAAFCYR